MACGATQHQLHLLVGSYSGTQHVFIRLGLLLSSSSATFILLYLTVKARARELWRLLVVPLVQFAIMQTCVSVNMPESSNLGVLVQFQHIQFQSHKHV